METQTKFFPKGQAREPFDKEASKTFQSDLYNLALDKDVAKKRNLLYLVLTIICVLSTIFVATTANYKTYVVRVDNTTGQVETGGQLKATNYTPKEAEIKHFLARFIADTRTIPLDPVQYKTNWNSAQHFLTQEAGQKMSELTKRDNPVARLGHITTQTQIRSIQLQPGSQSTYQVRWTEEEYSISGNATGKKSNYVALFSIAVDPPSKEEELLINPLGLKIRDMNYSKETESKE